MAELEIVYECPKCYVVIPYLGCFHGCPGVEEDLPDEEGFQEDLDEKLHFLHTVPKLVGLLIWGRTNF